MIGFRKLGKRPISAIRRVLNDTSGAVAVYLALGTMFLFPLIAVSIDLTSTYKLHIEVEQAAQAAALAGAKELNGTDAGLVTAENAARTAVTNYQSGATDDKGTTVAIQTVQFLEALPPAGNSNYEDYLTTKGKDAIYIRVITEVRERESNTLGVYQAVWNPQNAPNAASKFVVGTAVAGHTTVACRTMPLMTCNPAESATGVIWSDPPPPGGTGPIPNDGTYPGTVPGYAFFSDFLHENPQWRRRQVRIKFIGPSTQYASGVFGLLEPQLPGNHGAGGIEEELAVKTPTSCIQLDQVKVIDQVDVKTGQAATIVNGLNVRRDVYKGKWNSKKNDPEYAPAANVTKGHLPKEGVDEFGNTTYNYCKPDPAPPGSMSEKLPQDECFSATTLAELSGFSPKCFATGPIDTTISPNGNIGFGGRIGNAKYDLPTYIATNHPTQTWGPPLLTAIYAEESAWFTSHGVSVPPAPNVGTGVYPGRHGVYLWETKGYDDVLVNAQIPGGLTQNPLNTNPANTGTLPPEEEGRPMCSTQAGLSPERLRLWIAIVNCEEFDEELNMGQRIVKVHEFAEAFKTELADADASGGGGGGGGDKGSIYVEFLRAVKIGDADQVVLKDVIQLY